MTEYKKLDNYISKLGLEYSAVFVPFSKSRNAKTEIKSLSDYSINWKVTIKSLSRNFSIETDYMQGVGHLPEAVSADFSTIYNSIHNHSIVKEVCETGKCYMTNFRTAKLFSPTLRDVLYCLLLDAEAIDYDFQDWCSTYGYDEDSRKAESMYQECLQIGLKLRKVLGETHMNKLRELYQDY